MGGIPLTIVLLLSAVGCGMMNDVADTKEEVVKSNQNQEQLISQGEKMQRLLRESVGMVEKSLHEVSETRRVTAEKLDESTAAVNSSTGAVRESLDEVRKSNRNMEVLISQGQEVKGKLQESIDVVRESNAAVRESTGVVRESLEEVRKTNGNMKTLISQGKSMQEAITEQKAGILMFQILPSLILAVADEENEGHYRVAAARSTFELLLKENKLLASHGLDQKSFAFWAAGLETCANGFLKAEQNMASPYGELCTEKFNPVLALKGVELIPGDTLPDLFTYAKRIIGQMGWDHIQASGKKIAAWLPVEELRTNVLWAISLRPEILPLMYKHLIADPRNPQRAKVGKFLEFARHYILWSLENTFDETPQSPLETYKLQEILNRVSIARGISTLPGFLSEEEEEKLPEIVNHLVDKIERRPAPLSKVDIEILGALKKSISVTKLLETIPSESLRSLFDQ